MKEEFKKYFGIKLQLFSLCFLFLLGGVLCRFYVWEQTDVDKTEFLKTVESFFLRDADKSRELYESYVEEAENYETERRQWMMNGGGGQPPPPPVYSHTFSEKYSDFDLLQTYMENFVSAEDREKKVEKMVTDTERRLREYRRNGYDENSFSFKNNLEYQRVYEELTGREKATDGFVWGWDLFFSFEGVGLISVLAGVLLGCRAFTLEKSCGMLRVIRATKYGGVRFARDKIFFLLVSCALSTFAVFAVCLAVIGFSQGLSSLSSPLWQIKEYLLIPYDMSIGVGVIWHFVNCWIASVTFALLAAAFSLWLGGNALPSFALGTAVFVVEYLLLQDDDTFFTSFNLFSNLRFEKRFDVLHTVSVFGFPVSCLWIGFFLTVTTAAVAALLVSFLFKTRRETPKRAVGNSLIARFVYMRKQRKTGFCFCHSVHLFWQESSKIFTFWMGILIIFLSVFRFCMVSEQYDGNLTFDDRRKLMYMAEYEGMELEEVLKDVGERLALYGETLSEEKISQMTFDRLSGKISEDEYAEFRNLKAEAESHNRTLTQFYSEVEYLVEKQNSTGLSLEITFYKGFLKFFSLHFDVLLFAVLILMLSGVYAMEKESGMIPILRCTKKGRKEIFLRKFSLVLIISFAATVLFTAMDAVMIMKNYDMQMLSKPLVCCMRYSAFSSGITAGAYLAVALGVRLVGFVLFGTYIFALSALTLSSWATASGAILLAVPYVISKLGAKLPYFIDFSMILSGDRFCLFAASGTNAFPAIGCFSFFTAVVLLMLAAAYKKMVL